MLEVEGLVLNSIQKVYTAKWPQKMHFFHILVHYMVLDAHSKLGPLWLSRCGSKFQKFQFLLYKIPKTWVCKCIPCLPSSAPLLVLTQARSCSCFSAQSITNENVTPLFSDQTLQSKREMISHIISKTLKSGWRKKMHKCDIFLLL